MTNAFKSRDNFIENPVFKDDYNPKNLEKIIFKDYSMYVTPRYLYHYAQHDYEATSINLVKTLTKNSSVFVDIGAHYGYYCLVAHAVNNKIKIVAFEPIPENVTILGKNLAFNKINNCKIHVIAASNEKVVRKFNLAEASDSSSFYSHPLTRKLKDIKVKTDLPDNLLPKKVDFIKIDVEGHEIPVLDGLNKTIHSNSNIILLIEFNPGAQKMAGHKPQQLLKQLQSYGLRIFWVHETEKYCEEMTGNSNWEEYKDRDNYFTQYGYVNLICVMPKNNRAKEIVTQKTIEYGKTNSGKVEYEHKYAISTDRMISYAQNGEDAVLNRIFRYVKKGYYVDVGAADPIINSVTKHFYDNGWHGINIEPNIEFIEKYKTGRVGDINLGLGVAQKSGLAPFYFCEKVPEWSTFSLDEIKEHLIMGAVFIEKKVKLRPLKSIFQEHIKTEINFLKIDTEGFESEVIRSNDWKKYRPMVVVVESQSDYSWEGVLFENNYIFSLFDGLNRYYVRGESKELLKNASIPANVTDLYEPYYFRKTISENEERLIKQHGQDLINQENKYQQEINLLQSQVNTIKKTKVYRIWQKYCNLRDSFIK